jgi:DNA-binding PadR family transcriptional regulator
MKLLSRPEELILLAVWRLKEEAYCNPIQKQLLEVTGKKWSFGAVYDPLDRLEKKGLLTSSLGEPTAERGGKSKRIYRLTPEGMNALVSIREISDIMWSGISPSHLKTSHEK